MKKVLMAATAAAALAGAVLFASAPARADSFGIQFGPRGGIGFSFQSGGYCDSYGCPDDFWDYPVSYCPVYYHGYWYRGPMYYRVRHGDYFYWIHGGWHRDEWDDERPSWACEDRYGPALGIDFYLNHGFRWRNGWRDRWYRTHRDHDWDRHDNRGYDWNNRYWQYGGDWNYGHDGDRRDHGGNWNGGGSHGDWNDGHDGDRRDRGGSNGWNNPNTGGGGGSGGWNGGSHGSGGGSSGGGSGGANPFTGGSTGGSGSGGSSGGGNGGSYGGWTGGHHNSGGGGSGSGTGGSATGGSSGGGNGNWTGGHHDSGGSSANPSTGGATGGDSGKGGSNSGDGSGGHHRDHGDFYGRSIQQ